MAHHQNEGAWDRAQRDRGDDPLTAVEDRRSFREMVEHDGSAAEEAGDRGKQIRRAPKSAAGPAKEHCFKGAKEGRDRRQPPSSLSLLPRTPQSAPNGVNTNDVLRWLMLPWGVSPTSRATWRRMH